MRKLLVLATVAALAAPAAGRAPDVYLPGGPPRASDHALVWQHGPLTLRLEAAVGLDRALALARSVR